jgi:hypothetical protein
VDPKPDFSVVEINGAALGVAGYQADPSETATVHQFLLKLNADQFIQLAQIVNADTDAVTVKRIGVDDVPFSCRLGGQLYWSKSETDGSDSYIRALNCVIDHKPSNNAYDMASAVRAKNLEKEVAQLTLQLHYLIRCTKGVLTEAQLAVLSSPNELTAAMGTAAGDYWTGLDRTRDARSWFSEEQES